MCDGVACAQTLQVPEPSAIVQRREAVQASPRPGVLSSVDIRGEVAAVRELADLWKVYRPEWLIVFASSTTGEAGEAECQAHFDARFEGRVRQDDVAISSVYPGTDSRSQLLLRLPNIKGEFKTRELAEAYVRFQRWDNAVVVPRSGRAEHKLKEYGIKKLPREVV